MYAADFNGSIKIAAAELAFKIMRYLRDIT
jgi:hypothetical protein